MWRELLTLTCVVLFAHSSISHLNKDELQRAVDAFDGFIEPPRSNKAKDKVDFVTTEVAPEEATIRPLEDVPNYTTKKPDRVIPVREEVLEEEVVTEKAKCVVGCSIYLNVSNPDIIQFAKDSLRTIPNGNNLEFVRLIQAVREVQNRIIYYLTVEAFEKCEQEGVPCSNTELCVMKIERHPWRLTKPQITFQNCTLESSILITDKVNENGPLINRFASTPIFQENGNVEVESSTYPQVRIHENASMSDDVIVSSLNQEIIEAVQNKTFEQEQSVTPTEVQSTESAHPETTLSYEESYAVHESRPEKTTEVNNDASTMSLEVTTTEQNSPDIVTLISKSGDDVIATYVTDPN